MLQSILDAKKRPLLLLRPFNAVPRWQRLFKPLQIIRLTVINGFAAFCQALAGRNAAFTCSQDNTSTDIHASTRIRTHDPSFLAAEDSSCLRPSGHRDRRIPRYRLPANGRVFQRWAYRSPPICSELALS
jgi:hypothetical protein